MCKCCQMGISAALRWLVFEAEREFTHRMARKRKLEHYYKVVRAVKHSWGLCPECDQRLRVGELENGHSRQV
jgi:hypothetical protein